MDQQALDKRNEFLRVSTHFKVDPQTTRDSVPMWIWLQMHLEGMQFPPRSPSSSSGAGETRSEAMERYMSSRGSNVSDPDLWNYLHFGDELSDESEDEET